MHHQPSSRSLRCSRSWLRMPFPLDGSITKGNSTCRRSLPSIFSSSNMLGAQFATRLSPLNPLMHQQNKRPASDLVDGVAPQSAAKKRPPLCRLESCMLMSRVALLAASEALLLLEACRRLRHIVPEPPWCRVRSPCVYRVACSVAPLCLL